MISRRYEKNGKLFGLVFDSYLKHKERLLRLMKKNKNISKKNIVKRVLIIVFGSIILLAILLYKPVSDIVKAANFDRPVKTYKYEYQDITLSKEQMLEDFDYLFDVSVTNCLNKKYAEQYYKVDYDELYDTFKKRIENCQDEYEFVATMIAFDAKLQRECPEIINEVMEYSHYVKLLRRTHFVLYPYMDRIRNILQ